MQHAAPHGSTFMEIKKALTFRASSIGDCLMGKYLLENIHAQFPDARLGIVVASRGAMIKDLFAAYPWLHVMEVNRKNLSSIFALWRDFHGSDLVVTQYSGKKGGRFSLASKFAARVLAKRRGLIGFFDPSKWNNVLYDQFLPFRPESAIAEHEREVLKMAGFSVLLPFPTLECVRDSSVFAKFSVEEGKYVIAHFFAGGKGRSISPEKSRELLIALRETLPREVSIVVSGSGTERETALTLAHDINARVIAGEATLQEMMNLIRQSRAVVSVDTGMAHITAQLRKPLIVMRTCVGHNWWFPGQYGEGAPITIFSRDDLCADNHSYKDFPACINEIDIENVARYAATVVQ